MHHTYVSQSYPTITSIQQDLLFFVFVFHHVSKRSLRHIHQEFVILPLQSNGGFYHPNLYSAQSSPGAHVSDLCLQSTSALEQRFEVAAAHESWSKNIDINI